MSAHMEGEEPMETDISESEWLVQKARECIKSDEFTAKSLLITARTLFPQDLSVQVCNIRKSSDGFTPGPLYFFP